MFFILQCLKKNFRGTFICEEPYFTFLMFAQKHVFMVFITKSMLLKTRLITSTRTKTDKHLNRVVFWSFRIHRVKLCTLYKFITVYHAL